MNTYWRNLLTYLVAIPTAFLCCSLMRNQFRFSFRKVLYSVMAVLLTTIPLAAWADTYTSVDSPIIVFPLLIACFVPYFLATKCSFGKSLAIFAYVIALITQISSVSRVIDALFNPNAGQNEITVLYIVLQLILSNLTVALLNIPFRKKGVKLIDRMDLPEVWWSTVPTTLTCIFINVALTPEDYTVFQLPNTIGKYITASLLLVACFTTLTFTFYRTCSGIMFASRTEERARILEMQKTQFEAQQRYLEESSAVRHDFKQTMYTLRGLLQEQDYYSLGRYFDEFLGSVPESEVIRFCINQPLNALLNYYVNAARDSGVDLKLVIDPLEKLPVSDLDLCTIVGNILDNALAACGTLDSKDRFIQLSVVNESDANLFIVETNSFDGKTRRRNGRYLSVKRDGTGIGLSSVTHIAESYGGYAEFTNDNSVFYSNVMIPLSNTKAAAEA